MFGFRKTKNRSAPSLFRPLGSPEDLEAALEASEEGPVLLFKHSSSCGVSFFARREVQQLTEEGDPPVFEVVVQQARGVSMAISEMFSIRHASPQAILVQGRKAVWNASHGSITDGALRAAAKSIIPVLVMVLVSACAPSADQPAAQANPGQADPALVVAEDLPAAPEFTLPALTGDTYSLADQRGKVVIVNFWATWCGPCVRETPGFVDLQNELGGDSFEIVGVSLDQEGFEVIRPFAERYEVSYPMLLDDGALADEFGGVYAMPSSFIIDKEGRIAHRVVGEFPFEDLRPEIERMIAE